MFHILGVVVLALPVLVAASEVTVAPQPRPVVHYYPTTVGAKWVYRGPDKKTLEFVVTKVEPKDDRTEVTVCRVGADRKIVPERKYEVSGRGLLQVETAFYTDGRVDPFPLNPPVWGLKQPATMGERWHAEARPPYQSGLSFAGGKAAARVKVPAGEFDAVPVEVGSLAEDFVWGTSSQTIWFAPGVGPVKWTAILGGEVVLESFTPGK